MMKLLRISISCLVAGAGVGVLMGLSASPVVSGVLTTVLGVVCAVVGALAGIDSTKTAALKADPVPVAVLVVGLVVGAMWGIHMRTNVWFGPTGNIAKRVGLSESEVRRRAFEQLFPPRDPGAANATVGAVERSTEEPAQKQEGQKTKPRNPAPPPAAHAALLNVLPEEDCVRFQSIRGDALRAQLRATGNRKAIAIAAIADDEELGYAVKEILCGGD